MKITKGQSHRLRNIPTIPTINSCGHLLNSLQGSGSSILTPGFDCDSYLLGEGSNQEGASRSSSNQDSLIKLHVHLQGGNVRLSVFPPSLVSTSKKVCGSLSLAQTRSLQKVPRDASVFLSMGFPNRMVQRSQPNRVAALEGTSSLQVLFSGRNGPLFCRTGCGTLPKKNSETSRFFSVKESKPMIWKCRRRMFKKKVVVRKGCLQNHACWREGANP